ncbi:hypothetical protein ACJJIK_19765 [Microbulbifer sp. ZKSA006]|uniref:hypothetical protein n=1 Tax=Microbulbifer sp. ZKSA006 TaxID=3243390 RepID=UPI0040393C64
MPIDPPDPKPIDVPHFLVNSDKSNGQPVSTGSICSIKKGELEETLDRAESGNLEAALKMLNYYSFSRWDENKEAYWLEKCAELGDVNSQYNYAIKLMGGGEKVEALIWAKKALNSGHQMADSLIKEIEGA